MQRPDEKKRKDILAVAEELFATRLFHEVKLDEVAAKAKIGKGTIYIYFSSKEDLYLSLLREGFSELLENLQRQTLDTEQHAATALKLVIGGLVDFAAKRPNMYQLMRNAVNGPCDKGMILNRSALVSLIEKIIRRGVKRRELQDRHPEITAQFVPAAVRAAMLFGPRDVSPQVLTQQISDVFMRGLEPRTQI